MTLKRILSAAGIMIILYYATTTIHSKASPTESPAYVQLWDSQHQPVDFSRFRGKVVFVNNWATWCPPCIAELPSIQKLKKELDSDDFVFVMVSFDEDQSKAIAYIKKKGYDLEVYYPGDHYPYMTQSIPVTYILNKEGKVAGDHGGMTDYSRQEIVNFMKSLQ